MPFVPLQSLSPASGLGKFYKKSAKIIRFAKYGCANRPFYHIVVMERRKGMHEPVIEQVGSFDCMRNQYDERLVSLNFERIRHWIGKGAHLSIPVAELLGVAGFLPIHPRTYMTAWRRTADIEQQYLKRVAAKLAAQQNDQTKETTAQLEN